MNRKAVFASLASLSFLGGGSGVWQVYSRLEYLERQNKLHWQYEAWADEQIWLMSHKLGLPPPPRPKFK